MSDERENADAASEGTDEIGTEDRRSGQTAVVSPARPTGKRARRRPAAAEADATESGDTKDADEADAKPAKAPKATKRAKADAASGGGILAPFKFVWTYLGQVVGELRKVIWPNRKQMVTYTIVVLLFLAFMVAMIGFADLGLAKLVLWIFG